MDDLVDDVDTLEVVDSPENERSTGPGPEMARCGGICPGDSGEPGDGGVEGGVLELSVIVGFVRFFVGVVRGVTLGVTSDEDISLYQRRSEGTVKHGSGDPWINSRNAS